MQYPQFNKIDGRHPWRNAIPDAHVDYAVRSRRGGSVFYFNFELAKEMGLIPTRHPHRLNAALSKAILDTFSLVIINEYDIEHKLQVPSEDLRPHKYMATRYLQCQHPSKKGLTSGDGRSIWNGYIKGKNGVWDISSCGTGATCLSPATAKTHQFYKTGDDNDAYACGQADLVDGVSAALMSNIFHKNGIATERTLALIAFADGTSINVRAYQNLLRPAHLFRLLKQGRLQDLRAAVDYYIARQRANSLWSSAVAKKNKYSTFLHHIATCFARAAAVFESDYIFCWLDWDGDNVLMDGAVLDYGSVRQFGLYHHEYRYDDVERMSTTITEQKNKARYIVQSFAQIENYIVTGRKKNIRHFIQHRALKAFDKIFDDTKIAMMVDKLGFDDRQRTFILNRVSSRRDARRLWEILRLFERTQSRKGIYKIDDGITADALFCVRDILRELPVHYLYEGADMDAQKFINIMKSEYAGPKDVLLTPRRRTAIKEFQRLYRRLLSVVAMHEGRSISAVLKQMAGRSALINRYERVTGDAVLYVSEKLVKGAMYLDSGTMHDIFHQFVEQQVLRPEYFKSQEVGGGVIKNERARHLLGTLLRDVRVMRSGL